MNSVNTGLLSRAHLMDMPTVYAQQGGAVVENGFGRYLKRLEKHYNHNGYAVDSVIKGSLKEMLPQTMDGRKFAQSN